MNKTTLHMDCYPVATACSPQRTFSHKPPQKPRAIALTRLLTWVWMALAALWALASPAIAQLDLETLKNRVPIEHEAGQHRVMAFYYTWYGMPGGAGSQEVRHWGRIERENHWIENSENYPALGPYDSYEPQVINQHMTWAKNHGIDTLIATWWGHNDYTDNIVPHLLSAAEENGLKITVYYERVPQPQTPETAAEDIQPLLERYGDHPAWLRVGGRPVLFVYGRAVNQIGVPGWLNVQQRLSESSGTKPLLIGDRFSDMSALVFDGIHTYNTAGTLKGMDLNEFEAWSSKTYPEWVTMAENNRRISTLTLIPGYDDTKIRNPGIRVPRHEGELYRLQWETALKANPDWVLITSYNEWHEGSEIEPSREHGEKSLKMTGEFAKRFKSQPLRTGGHEQEQAISPAELSDLRQRLNDVTFGLLPRASSSAVIWMLTQLQVAPKSITWEQLVRNTPSPEQMPVLIYAADETYKQTVDEPGDVDRALQAYLSNGGWLMVLPSGPAPFYYNQAHESVANADKFGLPGITLSNTSGVRSWEKPPADTKLTFVQPEQRLKHLPVKMAFPKSGDLRWRPFDATQLAPADTHVPLLQLRSGEGEYLGDAIAYAKLKAAQPQGGRVLYAWFTLLQGPHNDALLYDLFNFAAERVKSH